jgi:prepilin-type N-terminal cleavage/methylation domain-containing protein
MKNGFTLIETIIAISMISLLILAIYSLTSLSIKMNLEANRKDEIFNIARSICEIYKSNNDNYSNSENEINIYKYVNSLSGIQSINNLILNKDGYYNESNYNKILNSNNGFKFTLILKIKKISTVENMELLYIEVVRNDGELMKISMNAAK